MILLSLKLFQHTPLLHFQGDQYLATLRASEVKPRLDKFIIRNEFNNDFSRCKGFLIGYNEKNPGDLEAKFRNGYRALNYKMRISSPESEEPVAPDMRNAPMFFGNMGDENSTHPKKLAMSPENILEIRIPETCSDLSGIILKHIGNMFMSTNFGTRKTKGYGSFTISDNRVSVSRPKLFFKSQKEDYAGMMKEIEWLHKAMRSGINDCFGRRRLYFKSLMFAYAKSKGRQWDKRTIKKAFLDANELESQNNRHRHNDITSFDGQTPHYDYRDCLGLSSNEKWGSYNMSLTKDGGDIERFPSPIIFKPVWTGKVWRVYIIYEELPEEFKQAEITIGAQGRRPLGTLNLGIDPKFSIRDFLDFIFKESNGDYAVDIRSLFSDETENLDKMNRILEIFEELRNNYNQ